MFDLNRRRRRAMIRRLRGAALLGMMLGALGGSLSQAGDTFIGSETESWSNVSNWSPDFISLPGNNFSTDIFIDAGGFFRFSTDIYMQQSWTMNSMTFLSGSARVTFNPGLPSHTFTIGAGGIENQAVRGHVFRIGIIVGEAAQTWRATAGNLAFTEQIDLSQFNLTLDGAFDFNLVGELIAGNSSRTLRKLGEGRADIEFDHNGTAAAWTLDIDHGTVRLEGAGRLADAQAVSISSGSTFDLNGISDAIGNLTGTGMVNLGAGTLTVGSSGGTFTFSGTTQGTGGFTKAGAGTLTLGGALGHTGATTVSAGRVEMGTNASLPNSSNLTVNSPGIIDFNNVSDSVNALAGDGNVVLGGATLTIGAGNAGGTWSGSITQTASTVGNLVKTGAGTQTFSADNSYVGTTTIQDGILSINADSRLGSGQINLTGGTLRATASFSQTRVIDISSAGGEISVNPGFTLTQAAALTGTSGAAELEKLGTGTLTLTADNSFAGDLLVLAGTVRLSGNGRFQNNMDLFISAGATVDFNGISDIFDALADGVGGGAVQLGSGTITLGNANATAIFSGPISGSGGVTKVGAGTLTFNGVSSYTGTTTVGGGTLRIGATGSLSASTDLSIASGATLDFDGGDEVNGLSGAGFLQIGGTLTLGGAGGGGVFSGEISGAGSLVKSGPGTLTLGGDNNTNSAGGYDGTTSLSGGALSISSDNNLGNGALVFNGGTLATSATFTQTRAITLNAAGGTIDVASATTLTQSAALSGAGGLTKTGAGTLLLNIAGGYAGATTINQGVLRLGVSNALPDATDLLINSGAIFDLNGRIETIDALSGDGTLRTGGGPLTIGASNGGGNFGGEILQAGALNKIGSGVATISGKTNFEGQFIIAAGTIRMSGVGQFSGMADVTVNSPGVWDLDGVNQKIDSLDGNGGVLLGGATLTLGDDDGPNTTHAGPISESGSLIKTGLGVQTLSGANSYTGTTTIAGGTLRISGSGNLGGGGIIFDTGALATTATFSNARGVTLNAGGGTLNVALATTLTQSGAIGGTGGLTKTGGGTLILAASNTYAGPTYIDAGVLSLSGAGGLPQTTDLTMGFETELRLNGANQTLDHLVGAGVILLGGGDLTLGSAGSDSSSAGTTFSGGVQGTGRLIKIGDGSQNLSGVNAHTGATLLVGGELAIHDIGALGTNAAPLIFDGGKLHAHSDMTNLHPTQTLSHGALSQNPGFIFTQAAPITGPGSFTFDQGGETILTAPASYLGATFIAFNATLRLQGAGRIPVNTDLNVLGLMDSAGIDLVLDMLGGSGRLVMGDADLTIGADGGSDSFSGPISGTGRVIKLGPGTQTLAGATPNSYTGGTEIRAGVLRIFSDARLGAAASGVLLDGGTLRISSGMTSNRAMVIQGLGGTFDVANTNTVELTGEVSGSGGLVKAGPGTLVLSNANTYRGTVTILQGILTFSSNENLNNAADVVIAPGAALSLGNTEESIDTLSGAGGVGLVTDGRLTIGAANGSADFSGSFSGVGRLRKIGAGSQTLSGQSIFLGDLLVDGGDLILKEGGALHNSGGRIAGEPGVGAAMTVQGDGSFWIMTGDLTVGALGTGSLNIMDGAEVRNLRGAIAAPGSAWGRVELTGEDSMWFNDESLSIGGSSLTPGGPGELVIKTGASAAAQFLLRTWPQGTLSLEGGDVTAQLIENQGVIRGTGVIYGALVSPGTLAPGLGAGQIDIFGDLTLSATSQTLIELGAASDALHIMQQASLAGELTISFPGGFVPAGGSSFDFITYGSRIGEFDQVNLPQIPNRTLDLLYLSDSVRLVVTATGLLGDFNNSGFVDALDIDLLFGAISAAMHDPFFDLTGDDLVTPADTDELVHNILHTYYGDANLSGDVTIGDLVLLASNYNLPGGWAQGDFTGEGIVSLGDLVVLAENFGAGSPPPALALAPGAVPLPASVWAGLGLLTTLGGGLGGRRRRDR